MGGSGGKPQTGKRLRKSCDDVPLRCNLITPPFVFPEDISQGRRFSVEVGEVRHSHHLEYFVALLNGRNGQKETEMQDKESV